MSDDFLKEIQDAFLLEASENLAQTESLFMSLEKTDTDHHETFVQLKRLAHNFKGSGKAVGFDELSKFSHSLENLLIALSTQTVQLNPDIVDLLLECNDTLKNDLEVLKVEKETPIDHQDLIVRLESTIQNAESTTADEKPSYDAKNEDHTKPRQTVFTKPLVRTKPQAQTAHTAPTSDDHIRIPMKKVDDLFNAFGEQVIYLSALEHFKQDLLNNADEIEKIIFNLKKITFDLQQSTLSLRMVGLKTLFAKLERAVRDVSRSTGKPVEVKLIGVTHELDKTIVDQVSDALVHMVRNAVDHGIESQEERKAAQKPEVGTIEIQAYREAGSFFLVIQDDGKGMSPEFIRQKALEKGLIQADQVLSEKETFDLIFEPGFSTKETVSEISGRGVGMNVVKEVVQALNGQLEIQSRQGQGTIFKMKLPLSLSLFNGLCFWVQGNKYIVPSSQVVEVINSQEVEIREISENKKRIVQIRDGIYPLVDLRNVLYQKTALTGEHAHQKRNMILVSEVDGKKIGFMVQQVVGIVRVVQKPLSQDSVQCPGAVGVTILGDGNPSLILDLRQLAALTHVTSVGLSA